MNFQVVFSCYFAKSLKYRLFRLKYSVCYKNKLSSFYVFGTSDFLKKVSQEKKIWCNDQSQLKRFSTRKKFQFLSSTFRNFSFINGDFFETYRILGTKHPNFTKFVSKCPTAKTLHGDKLFQQYHSLLYYVLIGKPKFCKQKCVSIIR